MITRYGSKRLPIAQLKLPGDIKQRQASKHVQELAKSLETTGGAPLNPPTVDKETMRVVTGCDRIAALQLLKQKTVTVELVSGDPIDLARATIAENLYRRQEDRDRLIKELVDLEQANISNAVLPKTPDAAPRMGRPSTGKKEAIEKEPPSWNSARRSRAVATRRCRHSPSVRHARNARRPTASHDSRPSRRCAGRAPSGNCSSHESF